MPILDELKKKANGKADSANNIAEAIAQMDFSEGSVTPEEIAESVSAYLDEHLTNPTNPPIDTSLTISGAAADAKETGDKYAQLKEDLNDFSKLATGYNLIDPTTIVDGEFWSGATATSGNYSRTPLIAVKPNTAYTFANTDANYWDTSIARARTIVFFAADGTYISPRVDNTGNFTTPENCAYVGISFYQNARKVILIEGTYDITTQTMVYIPYLADALKVDADSIDGLSVDNISDYKVTGKNLFDKAKAVSGFLDPYPRVTASENTYTSDYIPVKANVSYIIWYDYIESADFSLRSYVLYDVLHQKVTGEKGDKKNLVITPTVDGYLRFSGYNAQIDRTQVEVGTVPTTYEPYKEVFPNKALLNDSQLAQVNNILYGKKWVVLGDSFTNSGGTGTKISDGKYKGRNYTYPWIIGNRNNMEIVRFFEGGRTLAFPANPSGFTNSITCPTSITYYQNIPSDADYITIYLGINDEHHAPGSSGGDGEDNTGVIPLGTIDDADTSTYYGAWNVVLSWLIVNRPNAHIGIIATNGLTIEAYRTAQIEIARKYGIPFIDMNGDDRTPAMLRTVNPNIATSVKQALIAKWAVDPSSNTHPNDAAHLFESYFIENFLRSI